MDVARVRSHVLFIIRRRFLQGEVQSGLPRIIEPGVSIGNWIRAVICVREKIDPSVCAFAPMKR